MKFLKITTFDEKAEWEKCVKVHNAWEIWIYFIDHPNPRRNRRATLKHLTQDLISFF